MGSGRFLYRERNKGKSLEADTNNIVNTCTAANSEQADDMMLAEGIDIQKSSKRISNNMANEVFEDVKKQISASHEAYGKCENYKFVISSEREKKDGRIWEKLWIYYDLILVRKPEEDPLIICKFPLMNI